MLVTLTLFIVNNSKSITVVSLL